MAKINVSQSLLNKSNALIMLNQLTRSSANMNMMLGLEFCFSAVVTDNSRDTTDRNQRSCILKRNKIYDA